MNEQKKIPTVIFLLFLSILVVANMIHNGPE